MRVGVRPTVRDPQAPRGAGSKPVGTLARPRATAKPTPRWRTPLLLVGSDIFALLAAALAAIVLGQGQAAMPVPPAARLLWLLPLLPGIFLLMGLYPAAGVGPVEEMRRLFVSITAFSLALALVLVSSVPPVSPTMYGGIVTFWLLAVVGVPAGRGLVRHLFARAPWWGRPAIVLGAGKTSELLISRLADHPGLDLKIVGCLDDDERKIGTSVLGVPVSGAIRDAPALKERLAADYAIVAMPGISPARLSEIVTWLGTVFENVLVIPNAFGMTSIGTSTRDAGGVVGIHVHGHLSRRRNRIAKRLFDLVMLVPISLVALPVVAVSALAVFVISPGNPFFAQVREGHRGRPIRIWKLRTMKSDAEDLLEEHLKTHPDAKAEWESHFKLTHDPRVLPVVGSFLRRTSIDEFPQLFNVLVGELSLVGPRPFPYYHLESFDDGFRSLRSSVRPGLTGYWQVTSRSTADLVAQVELDSYYIKNWSLWLDLYIVARTPWAVLFGPGAY